MNSHLMGKTTGIEPNICNGIVHLAFFSSLNSNSVRKLLCLKREFLFVVGIIKCRKNHQIFSTFYLVNNKQTFSFQTSTLANRIRVQRREKPQLYYSIANAWFYTGGLRANFQSNSVVCTLRRLICFQGLIRKSDTLAGRG